MAQKHIKIPLTCIVIYLPPSLKFLEPYDKSQSINDYLYET